MKKTLPEKIRIIYPNETLSDSLGQLEIAVNAIIDYLKAKELPFEKHETWKELSK